MSSYARSFEVDRTPLTAEFAAPPAASPVLNAADFRDWLVRHFATLLSVAPDEIDTCLPFAQYGVDSIDAVSLTGELEDYLGCELPATLAWDYPTIELLAKYMADEYGTK